MNREGSAVVVGVVRAQVWRTVRSSECGARPRSVGDFSCHSRSKEVPLLRRVLVALPVVNTLILFVKFLKWASENEPGRRGPSSRRSARLWITY